MSPKLHPFYHEDNTPLTDEEMKDAAVTLSEEADKSGIISIGMDLVGADIIRMRDDTWSYMILDLSNGEVKEDKDGLGKRTFYPELESDSNIATFGQAFKIAMQRCLVIKHQMTANSGN